MPWVRCLKCGHRTWMSDEALKEGLARCTNYKCRSYWVMEEDKYERIINNLIPKIHDNTPILDVLNALIEVLRENGIKGRPLKTLDMACHVLAEAEKRKRGEKFGNPDCKSD